jgi:hypothetical protein
VLTERDRNIYNHIERYNFASIEQIQKIFFKEQKYSYDIARRRLNKLVSNDYLKCSRNFITNQNVYYTDTQYKRVSLHSMLLMNYYAELINCNAEIQEFEKEKEWLDGKIRSDGYCVYDFNGYRFYNLVEVNASNNKLNLEKYESLYSTGELQKAYGVFPTIVLIDDVSHKKEPSLERIEVIHLDFKLNDFAKIFM